MSADLKPFRDLVGYVVADYDPICDELFVRTPLHRNVADAFDHCNALVTQLAGRGYVGSHTPIVMEVRMQ